jgi:hypothetical protein
MRGRVEFDRQITHDFTPCIQCPECGDRLHGVKDPHPHRNNPSGVLWMCRRAIGELAFDQVRGIRYFPPESRHHGALKYYVVSETGATVPKSGGSTTLEAERTNIA